MKEWVPWDNLGMLHHTRRSPLSRYEELREKHAAEAQDLLPQYAERLSWSAEQIQQERQKKLRALIHTAKQGSPWHQKRLADIDAATVTEADLQRIPPMKKADLMEHWDDIVTDKRLNLDLVNNHLDSLDTDQYLLDEYHAVASGGSTGLRGVFAYDWQAWTLLFVMLFRRNYQNLMQQPEGAAAPPVRATVAASTATHLSSALPQTFFGTLGTLHRFPVTLPIAEIVEGLNRVQPNYLGGYPSALYLLSHEARTGRLRISPEQINTFAEPLLPEIRQALEENWGAIVGNLWGCSEGGAANQCGQGAGMHLNDDFCIVEPVDLEGKPVPPGVPSAKIYLTNLFNPTLPLIRYEVTDEVTIMTEPCPCGSAHSRMDEVMGRLDDSFVYASDLRVHPYLFRSALGGQRNILEYQVRQTRRGADIAIRCAGAVDVSSLHAKIATGLDALGLGDPALSITQVDRFERQVTGKLKRFIALESA
jgi:phenylacetate-CoA ligase